jgi:two-component system, NarL family, response regulator
LSTRDPKAQPTKISVLIVDDHHVVREGLVAILNREADICVLASAASGEEAVAMYQKQRPDVVLMDLQLKEMSGVDAIRAIREHDPSAAIIVLTMYNGDEHIRRALESGATTYLLKESVFDELVDAIRGVHAGDRQLPPEVKARLDERATQQRLSPREVHVLELVFEGQRNKEIAATLSISEETVHVHMKNIFSKLGVHDRTAAVHVALRRGIIHVTPPQPDERRR